YDELFALADATWTDHVKGGEGESARAVAARGEVQRIAALAARNNGDRAGSRVHLARARSLFAQSGCRTGLAMAMLAGVDETVDEEGAGPVVLDMLDAGERSVGCENDLYEPQWVLGVVAEKRGTVLTALATRERDSSMFAEARAAYERALALASSDER